MSSTSPSSPHHPTRPAPLKRSRVRRAGESAYGVLLLTRQVLLCAVALLLVVAGVWTSWDTARPASFAKSADRGTLLVEECDDDRCFGSFTPNARRDAEPDRVSIDKIVAEGEGKSLPVARDSGTDEVVRTGTTGLLYAWLPLGGALLLAGLVVAGGLRLTRTGWTMGLLGAALIGAAFVVL